VIANLLSNANKHTHDGVIELKMEDASSGDVGSDAQFVCVSVRDTGEGIPIDILPEIFERGISGSGGTGMGLAICKNIIEAHGGTIEVESKQGEGTRVTFTVPVYEN